MRKRVAFAGIALGCCLAWTNPAWSQLRGTDWTTAGNDAQRSSWIRSDAKISVASVRAPAFQLTWKLKLNNEPRQLNALTAPVLFDFYIGYRGFRSLAFLGGSSGRVFAIDTDLARMEWEKSLATGPAPRESTLDCPGGLTANLTRPTAVGLPPAFGFGGPGRRNPGRSGVGEPHQGAVTLAEAGRSNFRPPPAPASPRVRPAANPFTPTPSYVYALSSDGMLHTLYVSNGEVGMPAVKFLPPEANAHGLIVSDGVAYVATTHGCGGAPNGIWALDLQTKNVVSWKSPAGVAGALGPAIGPEGTIYAATAEAAGSSAKSHSLVALKSKTLEPAGSYSSDQGFTSTPVVIDYKNKDLIAVTVRDGSIHLLDGTNLGGADHRTPLHKTPAYSAADFTPGALAAWRDSAGTNWILAPAGGPLAAGVKFPATNGDVKNGAIVAWKIVEHNGAPALEPGWISRDMTSPLPPIVVNGVVFAVSSGEFHTPGGALTAEQRAQKSTHAVLYALDGATGKVLWESGDTITSFARGGLSAGGSTVYVGTYDGTLYAFGFPIEH
jgi:outer membrane protein assembly factor BamB